MSSQVKPKKPVRITPARLKSERGWSDGLIKRYLGDPDRIVPNPHYRRAGAKMCLYELERVVHAENNGADNDVVFHRLKYGPKKQQDQADDVGDCLGR